jgi:hypothetical protein
MMKAGERIMTNHIMDNASQLDMSVELELKEESIPF